MVDDPVKRRKIQLRNAHLEVSEWHVIVRVPSYWEVTFVLKPKKDKKHSAPSAPPTFGILFSKKPVGGQKTTFKTVVLGNSGNAWLHNLNQQWHLPLCESSSGGGPQNVRLI